MIQYVLNCSAIWLLSLVVYDLFLRKNTYHSYNRMYLIGSLIAGMLIPLFSFVQQANFSQQTKMEYGLDKAFELKSNLVSAAQINDTNTIGWEAWLWTAYLLGVLLSLTLLVLDIVKTVRLYRQGNKTTMQGLWLIETQQNHNPFSFFGFIFMSNSKAYTQEQLTMILAHEKRHNTLWHGMDLLLIQLCKIIFWFQPLVYIYLQRLRMVHEYQADKAVEKPLAEYGNFLLEQNILTPTPQLAHSFYYSPLKNRILMLTRKSSTWSKGKSLLLIPILGIGMVCFSKDAFSDNKRVLDGNKVTYKGNTFQLSESISVNADTIFIENPVTKEMEMKIAAFDTEPYPIAMNGEKISTVNEAVQPPVLKNKPESQLLEGIIGDNNSLLGKLDDGEYRVHIQHVVVGKKGEILYFVWDGLENTKWENGHYLPVTPLPVAQEFNTNIEHFVEKMQYNPALKEGKPVLYYIYDMEPLIFIINKHKVKLKENFSGTAVPLEGNILISK